MQNSRLVFVDLLRGWAVVVMIETHAFNAMIMPHFKETAWYDALTFVNGLVAPSFLFVSGFVFVLSTRRKTAELRAFGSTFWKQIGRMLLVWAVAYILHLPSFSYRRLVAGTGPEEWLSFYQADILHCIVVGWFLLMALFIVVRSETQLRRWIFAGGLSFVLAAPFFWDLELLSVVPAPLAAYLNAKHYSLFPIFPWLAFMFLGSYAALAYLRAMAEGNQRRFIDRTAKGGIALIFASPLFGLLSIDIPHASSDWQVNPFFFLLRLGIVFLLLAICWHYAERRNVERSFVLDVSRESFLVYVAHLQIIYGKYLGDKSIADVYGGTFAPLQCAVLTAGLIVLMVGLVKFWGWLKARSRVASRAVSYAVGAIAVLFFFLRTS